MTRTLRTQCSLLAPTSGKAGLAVMLHGAAGPVPHSSAQQSPLLHIFGVQSLTWGCPTTS